MPTEQNEQHHSFRHEFAKRIFDLSLAAFGLVSALAWNEAIQELVRSYIPAGSTVAARFIYAIVVTLLAVLVTLQLGRIAARLHLEDQQNSNAQKRR